MIQSRLTIYGMIQRFSFFAIYIGIFSFIPMFLIKDKTSILVEEKASISEWCFLILICIFGITASLFAVLNTRKILIAHDKITYTNWLTGKVKIYNFKDLDGYVAIIRRRRIIRLGGGDEDFESAILVKENKRIGEISSYFYSNYNELIGGLKDLKYLGQEDNNLFNSYKDYFNELFK